MSMSTITCLFLLPFTEAIFHCYCSCIVNVFPISSTSTFDKKKSFRDNIIDFCLVIYTIFFEVVRDLWVYKCKTDPDYGKIADKYI